MRQEHGFTLIETIVAVLILSIAVVGVMRLTGQSLFSLTKVEDNIAAYQVANRAIDLIDLQQGWTNGLLLEGVSEDGVVWRLETAPAQMEGGEQQVPALIEVIVQAQAPGAQTPIVLKTMRAVP